MGTRSDLLAVAAAQASAARENANSDLGNAGALVTDAKTALEAAALAQDIPGSAIDDALAGIQDLLEQAGVLVDSFDMNADAFMQATFRSLIAWRDEGLRLQGWQVAYQELRGLAERLQHDFIVGNTPVSLRIAERIQGSLDAADQVLKQANILGGSDGQENTGSEES